MPGGLEVMRVQFTDWFSRRPGLSIHKDEQSSVNGIQITERLTVRIIRIAYYSVKWVLCERDIVCG